MANSRATYSVQRIGWTLLAVGIILYIFWGGRLNPNPEPDTIELSPAHPESPLDPAQPEPPQAPVIAPQVNPSDEFSVAPHGFWTGLGSTKGHAFDPKLAAAISEFLKTENATSVLELGAGMGLYAKKLKADGIFVSCYDGNPDTQSLSEGRCGVIDLSRPLDLCNHDWVLSLEVGEHIPKEFEENFLHNLDNGNHYGMILSWAVEGQGGTSHVNNRNNNYIRETLYKIGYNSDFEAEKILRQAANLSWFKGTIMVFRRRST